MEEMEMGQYYNNTINKVENVPEKSKDKSAQDDDMIQTIQSKG